MLMYVLSEEVVHAGNFTPWQLLSLWLIFMFIFGILYIIRAFFIFILAPKVTFPVIKWYVKFLIKTWSKS